MARCQEYSLLLLPLNTKTPAVAGAFALLWMGSSYSFKELGSEVFLGDFRLR